MELNHESISPTAKMVSYYRQFTDIPYGKDIADLFKVKDAYRELFQTDMQDSPREEDLIPFLEVRYKSIQAQLEETEATQVLEFASGISLRGLAMTENPAITYVETDLPGLTNEKLKLLNAVMEKNSIPQRNNLFFASVNILNWDEIEPVLSHFDTKKPLTIVHEGLMQYLTKEEKSLAVKHIHRILKIFGGMWVTPDLDTSFNMTNSFFDKEKYQQFVDHIIKATGRDFALNSFRDHDEAIEFLAAHGFKAEVRSQMDFAFQLSSINKKLPKPEMFEALRELNLWISRLES